MRIEFLYRCDESEVSFSDQIAEANAIAAVLESDGDDIAKVRFDETILRAPIAALSLERELMLFLSTERAYLPYALDVTVE